MSHTPHALSVRTPPIASELTLAGRDRVVFAGIVLAARTVTSGALVLLR